MEVYASHDRYYDSRPILGNVSSSCNGLKGNARSTKIAAPQNSQGPYKTRRAPDICCFCNGVNPTAKTCCQRDVCDVNIFLLSTKFIALYIYSIYLHAVIHWEWGLHDLLIPDQAIK